MQVFVWSTLYLRGRYFSRNTFIEYKIRFTALQWVVEHILGYFSRNNIKRLRRHKLSERNRAGSNLNFPTEFTTWAVYVIKQVYFSTLTVHSSAVNTGALVPNVPREPVKAPAAKFKKSVSCIPVSGWQVDSKNNTIPIFRWRGYTYFAGVSVY